MKTYRKSIDWEDVGTYLFFATLSIILAGLVAFLICGLTDCLWMRTEYSDTMTGIIIEKNSYTEVTNRGRTSNVVYELYTMYDDSVDCIRVSKTDYVMHKVGDSISYRKKQTTGNVFGWNKESRLELVE